MKDETIAEGRRLYDEFNKTPIPPPKIFIEMKLWLFSNADALLSAAEENAHLREHNEHLQHVLMSLSDIDNGRTQPIQEIIAELKSKRESTP